MAPRVLRLVRPQWGAVRNAEDAHRLHQLAAQERQEALQAQYRELGVPAWKALGPSVHPPHGVQSGDLAALGARLTAFVAEGLLEGETCLVAATPVHRAALRQRLALAGLGMERVVCLDACSLLDAVARHGQTAFSAALDQLVREAGPRVRVYGDLAGVLHARGDLRGALSLETAVERVQHEVGFPLLCGYPPAAQADLDELCAAHTHLVS